MMFLEVGSCVEEGSRLSKQQSQAPMTGITRRRINDVRNVAEGQVGAASNTERGQRGNDEYSRGHRF